MSIYSGVILLKASQEMLLREVAGEYLLIPIGKATRTVKGMVALSESGFLLWNKLQNDCSVEDLVQLLLSEYEIDESTAHQDVINFLKQMNQLGILIR